MTEESTTAAISDIAAMVHTDETLLQTFARLLEAAQHAVPDADAVALTMRDAKGRPETPYFSDEIALQADRAQYSSDVGPCLDAWREERPIRIDDMSSARGRYPDFVAEAIAAGIHSTLSVPLVASGQPLGALNFYAKAQHAFSDLDEVAASAVVIPISASIANASAYWDAHALVDQLKQAMETRAVIEQAKGVVMASMGCDADRAFQILRSQSQAENRKLHVIAQELVDRQVH